jgi:hypothetical protein
MRLPISSDCQPDLSEVRHRPLQLYTKIMHSTAAGYQHHPFSINNAMAVDDRSKSGHRV